MKPFSLPETMASIKRPSVYLVDDDRSFLGALSRLLRAANYLLWEVFRQLDDRMTRYNPLFLKLFPDPTTRPRQREVLIELYRKGNVDEALRAFKKTYLEVVHQIIDHLRTVKSANSAH